eukprot:Nk52_evm51s210 gene=Nk52_evmTU51s210
MNVNGKGRSPASSTKRPLTSPHASFKKPKLSIPSTSQSPRGLEDFPTQLLARLFSHIPSNTSSSSSTATTTVQLKSVCKKFRAACEHPIFVRSLVRYWVKRSVLRFDPRLSYISTLKQRNTDPFHGVLGRFVKGLLAQSLVQGNHDLGFVKKKGSLVVKEHDKKKIKEETEEKENVDQHEEDEDEEGDVDLFNVRPCLYDGEEQDEECLSKEYVYVVSKQCEGEGMRKKSDDFNGAVMWMDYKRRVEVSFSFVDALCCEILRLYPGLEREEELSYVEMAESETLCTLLSILESQIAAFCLYLPCNCRCDYRPDKGGLSITRQREGGDNPQTMFVRLFQIPSLCRIMKRAGELPVLPNAYGSDFGYFVYLCVGKQMSLTREMCPFRLAVVLQAGIGPSVDDASAQELNMAKGKCVNALWDQRQFMFQRDRMCGLCCEAEVMIEEEGGHGDTVNDYGRVCKTVLDGIDQKRFYGVDTDCFLAILKGALQSFYEDFDVYNPHQTKKKSVADASHPVDPHMRVNGIRFRRYANPGEEKALLMFLDHVHGRSKVEVLRRVLHVRWHGVEPLDEDAKKKANEGSSKKESVPHTTSTVGGDERRFESVAQAFVTVMKEYVRGNDLKEKNLSTIKTLIVRRASLMGFIAYRMGQVPLTTEYLIDYIGVIRWFFQEKVDGENWYEHTLLNYKYTRPEEESESWVKPLKEGMFQMIEEEGSSMLSAWELVFGYLFDEYDVWAGEAQEEEDDDDDDEDEDGDAEETGDTGDDAGKKKMKARKGKLEDIWRELGVSIGRIGNAVVNHKMLRPV